MFENILPEKQQSILEILKDQPIIEQFYLAGGTGLALQLGHRRSLDFAFFTQTQFRTPELLPQMGKAGDVSLLREAEDTLTVEIGGTQLSFFRYDYPLLRRPISFKGKLKIAQIPDIATTMKLTAISGRGSKKDFIDLFFVCKTFSLKELFEFLAEKYDSPSYSEYHILKSLVYFADAEEEPMPEMLSEVSWREVKTFFQEEVKKLAQAG